jgi:IclR family acetate operon transcriptional repressor
MSADSIEDELSSAADRGYHQSSSEYIADLAGVGVPLPLGSRRLSIVVAGPTSRCFTRRPAIAEIMQRAIADHPIAL